MAKMDEATRKRVRAGRLLLAGKTPAQAAHAVGVARQTAYTWKAVLDEGGIDALRAMPTRAARRVWTSKQLQALGRALLQAHRRTALAPSCGRSSASAFSSSACTASSSARPRSGASWAVMGFSVAKARAACHRARRGRPCRPGSARPGLRSKKSLPRRTADRLHRRVGPERAAHAGAHLGTQGATPIIQFHFNWTHISVIAGLTRTNCLFRLHEGASRRSSTSSSSRRCARTSSARC